MKKTLLLIGILLLSTLPATAFHEGVEVTPLLLVNEGFDEEQSEELIEIWNGLDTNTQHAIIRKCASADNKLECSERVVGNDDLSEIVEDEREKGLERALEVVNNSIARERIERNLLMFQERKGIVYDRVDTTQDTLTGEIRITVTGMRTRKVFFIPITAEDVITYDKDGVVVEERESFGSKVLKLFKR